MTGTRGLDAVARSTVFDRDGHKVGKVEQLYIDEGTKLPTWVAVKTGWFGAPSLVPLAGARHEADRIDIPTTKDAVKDAPHLDTDGGITRSQRDELLQHYGLTAEQSGWDTYGRHSGGADTTSGVDTTRGDAAQDSTAQNATAQTGAAQGAAQTGAAQGARTPEGAPGDREATVVRSEEQLDVGTERVTTGTARLRKYVVTEQQTVTVPVSREEVEVVREPISADAPGADIGEEVAEVTLHEDQVTTDKRTVPVERVGLAVNEVEDERVVSDTVRKERVDTEQVPTRGGEGGAR